MLFRSPSMPGGENAEFRFASIVFNDQNAARSMAAGPDTKGVIARTQNKLHEKNYSDWMSADLRKPEVWPRVAGMLLRAAMPPIISIRTRPVVGCRASVANAGGFR